MDGSPLGLFLRSKPQSTLCPAALALATPALPTWQGTYPGRGPALSSLGFLCVLSGARSVNRLKLAPAQNLKCLGAVFHQNEETSPA